MRPFHISASSVRAITAGLSLCLPVDLAVPAGAQAPATASASAASTQTVQPAQASQVVPSQQAPAPQESTRAMGTVATADALVAGGLRVQGDSAELVSNASVTAHDRTAVVQLARGGEVLVCATSQLHLLHSGDGKSLLFGLDRGALQIHTFSEAGDVILTPDLRFTIDTAGELDLSVRVTRDGDTCVDNAGSKPPVLALSDAFSTAAYRLLPNQHVLFEHGNLREVVDREEYSCGCPGPEPLVETAVTGAAAQHPFPEAASAGLTPETVPANSAPAGEKHTQVAATLTYAEGQPPPPSTVAAPPPSSPKPTPPQPSSSTAVASQSLQPPPSPPGAHTIFHAIGRFFHRLFTTGASPNPPAS